MQTKIGETNKKKSSGILSYKIHGVPVVYYAAFSIPVIIGMYTQKLKPELTNLIAIMFVIGVVSMWIGDKLPIWNKWIGGGSMMAMMLPSFMVYKGWIPQVYVKGITSFYSDLNFLNFYIIFLISGSLLTVNRTLLLKTLKKCGPVFAAALIFAAVGGMLGGLLTGASMGDALAYYVLPNLGGGNGSGAVPMSQIFEQITGTPKATYYNKAIAILTLGSTIALIAGVVLSTIGKKKPGVWVGNGKTLIRGSEEQLTQAEAEEEHEDPTLLDMANSLLMMCGFYALAVLFGKMILPKIGPVIIHEFAYLILFLTLANVFNVIPARLRFGAEKLNELMSEKMGPFIFAGLGIAMLDFKDFLGAMTLQNLFISFMIILGVVVGSGVVGNLVGFYPIDAIITLGLTVSNRGDSADIILLTATDRMSLLPYSQVVSKLGGAIVLALSSMVFVNFFG
jgi:Na+/citrate or Na+/malate symporter